MSIEIKNENLNDIKYINKLQTTSNYKITELDN